MRVVICGAGIAGLAAAQCLATLGWEVVVLERAPAPRTQGYMIDFFGPGYVAAERMGVLPRLAELGHVVEEVSYHDGRGRRRAGLSYDRFAQAVDGRVLSIMRPDLEQALREHLPDGVDLRFGAGPVRIDHGPDRVEVTLADGTRVAADLLVGADGVHSTVRRLVFGPHDRFVRHLGLHTAAYTVDDPWMREQVGDRFCLTDTAGRQMGFYGLRDGRVAVFAVRRTPERTLPADPRRALRETCSGLGWIAPRALAACPPPEEIYYDHVAQVEIPTWRRDRVVLLGDACQAVSLLAGQGASLAVAGAHLLGEQVRGSASLDAALDGYQRRWQPVIAQQQRNARRAAAWFLPRSTPGVRARRVVLALAALPVVGRRVAAGLAGKGAAGPATTGSAVHGTG
jgi:2-polyprenyl-6-methoxyphenol hydroxylase-like FAD-dependent oxidoreductase